MSRALILGGTGAIGRATAHRLLDAGWQVELDMTAAAQLGYQPSGDYAATVAATVDWLVAGARGGPDAGLLPTPADEYFARYLDYPAEDRYLAGE